MQSHTNLIFFFMCDFPFFFYQNRVIGIKSTYKFDFFICNFPFFLNHATIGIQKASLTLC